MKPYVAVLCYVRLILGVGSAAQGGEGAALREGDTMSPSWGGGGLAGEKLAGWWPAELELQI